MPYTVIRSDSPIVEVRGLRKAFGATDVLVDLDLQIPRGGTYALLGRNGAGKTTLLRILSTLNRPDAGTVTVAGHDVVRESFAVRGSISLTGQNAAVDEQLTGRENLVMIARLRRWGARGARRRADHLIGTFGLEEFAGRIVKSYSGGMRRRLDLAAGMVTAVPLVFLDEPTTGLDPVGRDQLWGEVRSLARDGTTVLLTTQYLHEADALADRIGILAGGRMAIEGTAAELKGRGGTQTVTLTFTDNAAAADASVALTAATALGTVVTVTTDGSADAVHRVLDRLAAHGHRPVSLAVTLPTLDDVFTDLTGTPAPATLERESA